MLIQEACIEAVGWDKKLPVHVRKRPRAIPLTMITMGKSTQSSVKKIYYIQHIIFVLARERAEFIKSFNLIGS